MCGIIGHISKERINKDDFKNKTLNLSHRGPDGHGFFFGDGVALGHTRLSIIDLSEAGQQPMFSGCGNYVIIYNGEIYNFAELRAILQQRGYSFKSRSDTEVLLNGFIEYGVGIVGMITGMFSFAIYSKLTRELFLARDRSGIKPLYYYHTPKDFIFSSELKVLHGSRAEFDDDAKVYFLLLGYIPDPLTIVKGACSFPAGHFGLLRNNSLTTYRYDSYTFGRKIAGTYSDIVSSVRNILEESINRHLISDAPIGVFLSGGLDSSLITAIASKQAANVQTVSLAFEDEKFNEEHYQDLVVASCGTKHTKYIINEDSFISSVKKFTESMEQPTVDGLNTYFISEVANKVGLKTVLSGIGGDELFYGYPSFKSASALKFLSLVPYSLVEMFALSGKYKKLELLRAERELAYYLPRRALFSPSQIAAILQLSVSDVYELIAKLWHIYNSSHILNLSDKICYFELEMYMKCQLLRDADKFGMAHSLEIRVPFLDKQLIDYVLSINPSIKFGKHNKQMLADACKDLLPSEILSRRKKGFVLPFEQWFRKSNMLSSFDAVPKCLGRKSLSDLHWSRLWALYTLKKFMS